MSSWKQSFEIVTQELALAKKKKQALDDLLVAKRVSQPTYEHLEKGLTGTIRDLEAQQRLLADKMTERAGELEEQINLIESFLANLEIRNAAGEISEETYTRHKEALVLGLDATKSELSDIKSSLAKIIPQPTETSAD